MMDIEVGKTYRLTAPFDGKGLGWGDGTILTVLEFPYLPEFLGNTMCLARGGVQDIALATPVELLEPIHKQRRRRRRKTSG